MEKESVIINYLNEHNIITVSDAISLGVSRSYLYKLVEKGVLVNLGNGLFSLVEGKPHSEYESIIEVCRRVPYGVVSLLSALTVHGITTQLPHEVWMTTARGKWKPIVEYPSVHYNTATEITFNYGVELISLGNSSIKVYSIAKTIADCFKFRNQVGLDVAIEALREAWHSKKVSMDEIVEAAKVCRVLNIMKPYLEAIV